MNEKISQILKKNKLFEKLSSDVLSEIAENCRLHNFETGDTIVTEGDVSDSIYIISEGITVVKQKKPDGQAAVIAYLLPGQTIGEMGVIQETPRTATVIALCPTEALKLSARFFMQTVVKYGEIGLHLSKILATYLTDTNKRWLRGGKRAQLTLVIDVNNTAGSVTFSRLLAQELDRQSTDASIYAEWPYTKNLQMDLRRNGRPEGAFHMLREGLSVLSKPSLLPYGDEDNIPLTIDKLLNSYSNVIFYLTTIPPAKVQYLGEHLTHLIYLHSGKPEEKEDAQMLFYTFQSNVTAQEVSYYQIALAADSDANPDKNEFALPEDTLVEQNLTGFEEFEQNHPELLFCKTLVDRFERNNRIGIYIPSKFGSGAKFNPTKIIDKTMVFLGKYFGGATVEEVKGVWKSDKIGIVGEKIHLVYTYTTPKQMKRYLNKVIVFTRKLKKVLQQDAMALEVNKKLTLI